MRGWPTVDSRVYTTVRGQTHTYYYPHLKASERCKEALRLRGTYLTRITGQGSGGRWRPSNGSASFSGSTVTALLNEGWAYLDGGLVKRRKP